jgi:hypothetical protein
VIALALLACATRVRYEPVLHRTLPPPVGVDPVVLFDRAIAEGLAVQASPGGEALPAPVAWVAWLYAGRSAAGGEYDVTFEGWNVEIVRPDRRAAVVRWAPAPPPAAAPELPEVDLVAGDRAWSATERDAVARAWALLPAHVAAVVQDVPLWRGAVSPRRPRAELSWYDTRTSPPRIEVFDLAFADEAHGFAGAPSAPVGLASTTVLHELGHAFADAPSRRGYRAYLEAFAAGGDDRAAWQAYRAVQRRDPVISAFRQVWLPPGPTAYARRRVHEAFAESFYLFYSDPDALRRVAPTVYTWFAVGGPYAALTEPG